MTRTILLIILLSIGSIGYAQDPCDCSAVFEKLVQKVGQNYIGYALTKEEVDERYQAHIKVYSDLTQNASNASCIPLLQRFLEFFKDRHLFVTELPDYDAGELSVFKSGVREKMFDVRDIYKRLTENKGSLDNIEGIWTDGESKYAIVKNQNANWNFDYVAVILSHVQPDKIGELKFGVTLNDGRLEGTYYTNSYAPSYTKIDLAKESSLLSIWGGRFWGRVAYTDESSVASAKLFNPKAPTVSVVDAETILLSIPSFLMDKNEFDKVVDANSKALRESKYLIIDIRGNNGGNGIYFDVLKFFSDRAATGEVGLALASVDNIAYFEKFGSGPVYAPVVKAMKEGMGKIVGGPQYGTLKLKSVKSNIERVAIITDGSNMSAAESFILHAKGVSSRVMTIGKNTRGVIDYQSINMVKLGCEKRGIYFGYPTSTGTKDVPKKGYNKTGISPDVFTEKTGSELIDFVKETLKK